VSDEGSVCGELGHAGCVEVLRARLTSAEAERDDALSHMQTWRQVAADNKDAYLTVVARLAEVEAERDAALGYFDEAGLAILRLQRRLAAVEALCDVDDGDVVTRAEVRAAARGETQDRAAERPPCFDNYECETRGCYAESVGVVGCYGARFLRSGSEDRPTKPLTWAALCAGAKGYPDEPDCGTCWGCLRVR
jgi:hypothetical protein